jgi:hypothetical protein
MVENFSRQTCDLRNYTERIQYSPNCEKWKDRWCDKDVKCVTLIVRCFLDMLYESMVTKSFIRFPSIAQIHIIKVKRKFSEINTTDLIQDLNTSKILQNREGSVVNVVKLYNSELSSIIDKHAPSIKSFVKRCRCI